MMHASSKNKKTIHKLIKFYGLLNNNNNNASIINKKTIHK